MTKSEALEKLEDREKPLDKPFVRWLILDSEDEKPCPKCLHYCDDDYCEQCKFGWDSNFEEDNREPEPRYEEPWLD